MSRKQFYGGVLCGVLLGLGVGGILASTGCTTVTDSQGKTKTVLGFGSPEEQKKAQDTVDTVSSFLPPPFNYIASSVGSLGILLLSVYGGKKKGEDIGWDMAHKESPVLAKPTVTG